MNKQSETISTEVGDLAEEARALLTATAGAVGDNVSTARNRLAKALESSKEMYGRVREKAIQGAKATDEMIHENPYRSIAIGLGVGAILGYLLARRTRADGN